jgi:cytochrome bd ubiquinol oxidase subunit II
MDDATYWLPVAWAALIGASVAIYVILDGFDLGVGILFSRFHPEEERDQLMNSVAPFWDGNETWLVLGGGGLFVAFPLAYAIIMPALYIPVIVMLLALVFRGVAFEYRWIAKPRQRAWDYAFAGGSIVAAFCQGLILGGLLNGIAVREGAYAGGPIDWLTPFSVFVGLAVVAGYGLLGATWLVMRLEGELAARARSYATPLLVAVLAAMVVVSVWTPLVEDRIFARWFTFPNIAYLAPIPLAALLVGWLCWRALDDGRQTMPFLMAVGLFLLAYAGLVVSNLPWIVPPTVTIWDAAAAPSSQLFMLIGTVALLPLILGYTAFVYWTFRGKVRHGEGYH